MVIGNRSSRTRFERSSKLVYSSRRDCRGRILSNNIQGWPFADHEKILVEFPESNGCTGHSSPLAPGFSSGEGQPPVRRILIGDRQTGAHIGADKRDIMIFRF